MDRIRDIFLRGGSPFSKRRSTSQQDLHARIDFVGRTGVPLETAEEIRPAEPRTAEVSLAA